MTMLMTEAPVVTLTNRLRVANFSSPHSFTFVDGSMLMACAPDRVAAGALSRHDVEKPFPGLLGVQAITPVFKLSPTVLEMLDELNRHHSIEIVLIPFPVLEALRNADRLNLFPKVATISVADRQTKAIHIDRFCR